MNTYWQPFSIKCPPLKKRPSRLLFGRNSRLDRMKCEQWAKYPGILHVKPLIKRYQKHVSDLLLHAFINPYLFSLNKIQLSLTPEYPRKFISLKIFFPVFFCLFLSQTGNDCSSFPSVISFSKLVTDHVLEGRVISTVHVTSDQECQMKCILSEICDSFNLGPQTASRLYPCEILDQRSSRKVIKREQWKFRARWVSG